MRHILVVVIVSEGIGEGVVGGGVGVVGAVVVANRLGPPFSVNSKNQDGHKSLLTVHAITRTVHHHGRNFPPSHSPKHLRLCLLLAVWLHSLGTVLKKSLIATGSPLEGWFSALTSLTMFHPAVRSPGRWMPTKRTSRSQFHRRLRP